MAWVWARSKKWSCLQGQSGWMHWFVMDAYLQITHAPMWFLLFSPSEDYLLPLNKCRKRGTIFCVKSYDSKKSITRSLLPMASSFWGLTVCRPRLMKWEQRWIDTAFGNNQKCSVWGGGGHCFPLFLGGGFPFLSVPLSLGWDVRTGSVR